jgi:predicted exporter
VVGGLGLLGAFAAVTLVLPAVLTLWDTRRLARRDTPADRQLPFRFDVERLLGAIDRRRVPLIAASLLLFAAAAVLAATRPGGVLPLEEDLYVMHPQPNPALAAQQKLVGHFGVDPVGGLMVHLSADTPERLQALAHEVDRRLSRPAVRAAGVAGTLGLASLLPDPAIVARRRTEISAAEVERVVADFRAAIADSLFEPAAYEPYAGFLRLALTQQNVPTVGSLADYPAVARNFLPRSAVEGKAPATEAITLVFLGRTTHGRSERDAVVDAARAALADLPGATLTGLPVIGTDAESAVRQDLPRLMAVAVVLVVLYLLVHFRSAARAVLALTPVLFSLVVLAGAARLLDLKLNLVNLVALPLLVGIDVDYGIYLVSLADSRGGGGGVPRRRRTTRRRQKA